MRSLTRNVNDPCFDSIRVYVSNDQSDRVAASEQQKYRPRWRISYQYAVHLHRLSLPLCSMARLRFSVNINYFPSRAVPYRERAQICSHRSLGSIAFENALSPTIRGCRTQTRVVIASRKMMGWISWDSDVDWGLMFDKFISSECRFRSSTSWEKWIIPSIILKIVCRYE